MVPSGLMRSSDGMWWLPSSASSHNGKKMWAHRQQTDAPRSTVMGQISAHKISYTRYVVDEIGMRPPKGSSALDPGGFDSSSRGGNHSRGKIHCPHDLARSNIKTIQTSVELKRNLGTRDILLAKRGPRKNSKRNPTAPVCTAYKTWGLW